MNQELTNALNRLCRYILKDNSNISAQDIDDLIAGKKKILKPNSILVDRLINIMDQPDPEITDQDVEDLIMEKTGFPIAVDYSMPTKEVCIAGNYPSSYDICDSQSFQRNPDKDGKHSEIFLRVPVNIMDSVMEKIKSKVVLADGYQLLRFASKHPRHRNNTIALESPEEHGNVRFFPAIKEYKPVLIKESEELEPMNKDDRAVLEKNGEVPFISDWYVLLVLL